MAEKKKGLFDKLRRGRDSGSKLGRTVIEKEEEERGLFDKIFRRGKSSSTQESNTPIEKPSKINRKSGGSDDGFIGPQPEKGASKINRKSGGNDDGFIGPQPEGGGGKINRNNDVVEEDKGSKLSGKEEKAYRKRKREEEKYNRKYRRVEERDDYNDDDYYDEDDFDDIDNDPDYASLESSGSYKRLEEKFKSIEKRTKERHKRIEERMKEKHKSILERIKDNKGREFQKSGRRKKEKKKGKYSEIKGPKLKMPGKLKGRGKRRRDDD